MNQLAGREPSATAPAGMPAGASSLAAGLADPASVYYEEQGGRLGIRGDASGGQKSVCLFDDGSESEEWAFFRGECRPGQAQRAEDLME